MKLLKFVPLVVITAFLLSGCPGYRLITDMDELVLDEEFLLRTTDTVSINLDFSAILPAAKGVDPEPSTRIPVEIRAAEGITYDDFAADPPVEREELYLVGTILLDSENTYSGNVSVPSIYDSLVLYPLSSSLPNGIIVNISADEIASFTFYTNRGLASSRDIETASRELYQSDDFTYLGSFNDDGLPDDLLPDDREDFLITSEMLDNVTSSLPEYKKVPIENPEYLNDANIRIKDGESAEVTVIFIHEGAGYRNALGFYAYDDTSMPSQAPGHVSDHDEDEVNDLKLIFPNASLRYSSGVMKCGDAIDLGTFTGGETLIWALIANSWSSSAYRNTNGVATYYSKASWNPEEIADNQQHTVVLLDELLEDGSVNFIVGFEDLNRDSGGDEDFNDLVFMVNVTPSSAVEGIYEDTFELSKKSSDRDQDGVADAYDDYPDNPELARTNEYSGTIAFEDQWPAKGDYDFNDLVAYYTYTIRTDSSNRIRSLGYQYDVRALGAGYKNGLGLFVPVDSVLTDSTAGAVTTDEDHDQVPDGDVITTDRGVMIEVSSNLNTDVFGTGATILNTKEGDEYVTPVTSLTGTVYIDETEELFLSDLGDLPFDVFLLQEGNEDHEIHFPGRAPSGNADQLLLGTGVDTSDEGSQRYYLTVNNMPWALHLPIEWDYPLEGSQVITAYPHLSEWAQSDGQEYRSWYLDEPGNRVEEHIYQKP